MNYWILSRTAHVAEYPNWLRTQVAALTAVPIDSRLRNGDIIYLYNPEHDAIYGWGYAQKRGRNDDEYFDITVAGGKIQNLLTPLGSVKATPDLSPILDSFVGATAFLLNKQVRALDNLMVAAGNKPFVPAVRQFILGLAADDDEGLTVEYKQIAVGQIPSDAYDYAVAFLHSAGGSIIFGVRDVDKVTVGIRLTYPAKDRLNCTIENKLLAINPRIRPVKDYNLYFHNVIDTSGNSYEDLYVVELEVRPNDGVQEHKTSGGKIYEKTFSGKRKLT